MHAYANSVRLRLIGGIVLGATVAGAAVSWALSSNSQQNRPITEDPDPNRISGGAPVMDKISGVSEINRDHYDIAALTDTGKKRSNNQDSFRLGEFENQSETQALCVVCDGMGGHAGGEVASQIAADLIWTVVSKQNNLGTKDHFESMVEAIERADAAIEQRASKEKELAGMGTTAVLASVGRDSYTHCYLGDSRLYHFRGDTFIYQTKDHSVVRFLIEEGIITADEAREHPYRSQLTSSLGGGPNANRITIEPKWDQEMTPHRLWESGDWLLLCSDGLNSELEDHEIAKILKQSKTPKEAVLALKEQVLKTDARDNVTLIVAQKK